MHGPSKPGFITLKSGDTLVRQGQLGSDLYLVLDGVIRVDRDGAVLAEYEASAIPGRRAHLEAGARTSAIWQ
jgi:CRP-like cAMP-binding protein